MTGYDAWGQWCEEHNGLAPESPAANNPDWPKGGLPHGEHPYDYGYGEGNAASVRRWCRICGRVGRKKGWPMGVGDALIGPRGTLHHQKEDGSETTVCGLGATGDGWRWPE